MEIAILLTCHNRREKTVCCLKSLKKAIVRYNKVVDNECIRFQIFLADDGCTDGTSEAVRNIFPDDNILHILQGDGNLFWAGGMRFCWEEAMKHNAEWDYYLLINDDTIILENVFTELLYAEQYAIKKFGKKGVVSGTTCAINNPTKMTYGGDVWVNKFLAKSKPLVSNGEPQLCDLTNANILLVPTEIVEHIGIFYAGFQHGQADYDYSNSVRKAGYPVVITANFCGRCDNDHLDTNELAQKVIGMSLKERKVFFNNPIHSSRDYLRFVRRISPFRVPLVWIGRKFNLYFPKLYYHISNKRREL